MTALAAVACVAIVCSTALAGLRLWLQARAAQEAVAREVVEAAKPTAEHLKRLEALTERVGRLELKQGFTGR